MPRSGKLPVVFVLIGQKSRFSPRTGDSLHRFRSNFPKPTGTWVRLAVRNWWSRQSVQRGGNAAQKYPKFPLLGTESPRRRDSLGRFRNFFWGFYTPDYPTLVFQISCDSLHRLRIYWGEIAHWYIKPNFSVHPVGKTIGWIEKWMNLFWWARQALSPCKVWGRSYNARRL